MRDEFEQGREVESARIDTLYETPEVYQKIFSYREISAECDIIAGWCGIENSRPARVLELAAGPPDHAIESNMLQSMLCIR